MLVWIVGLLYLVWGVLMAQFHSSWWGWGSQPSGEELAMRFRKHIFPVAVVTPIIFAVGLLLYGPWKFKRWHAYFGITVLTAFLVSCLWPVTTHVTGNTRITLVREDGTPFAGLRAKQEWGMGGYFDRGGTDVRVTDANGTVHFPPRVAKGSVGMRLLRRAWAFVFVESTERWEPGIFIEIDLPQGYWIPDLPLSQLNSNYLDLTYFPRPPHHDPLADPPLLYYQIDNLDPLHSHTWIMGRASGIAGDEDIVLKVRPTTPAETQTIDQDMARQNLLEFEQNRKGSKRYKK